MDFDTSIIIILCIPPLELHSPSHLAQTGGNAAIVSVSYLWANVSFL